MQQDINREHAVTHPAEPSAPPPIRLNIVWQQAVDWVVELARDDSVGDRWPEFEEWINADPEHRRIYRQVEAAWRTSGAVLRLALSEHPAEGPTPQPSMRLSELQPARVFGARAAAIGVAAVVLIALAATLCVIVSLTPWTRYQSVTGEIKDIVLSDGSLVTLNENSNVSVRITPLARQIQLIRGEAMFNVARNFLRPFWVDAGLTRVRAKGTHFSVKRDADGHVDTLVTQGQVQITTGAPAGSAGETVASSVRLLGAGEMAGVASGRISVQRLERAELQRRLAWTEMIELDGTLEEAVAKLNQFNSMHLVLADPSIGTRRVGGIYRRTDPDGFAHHLESALHLTSTRVSRGPGEADVIMLKAQQKNK